MKTEHLEQELKKLQEKGEIPPFSELEDTFKLEDIVLKTKRKESVS